MCGVIPMGEPHGRTPGGLNDKVFLTFDQIVHLMWPGGQRSL